MTKPRTRAGCKVQGACPFVSCRYHLFVDVSKAQSLIAPGRKMLAVPGSDWSRSKRRRFTQTADEWMDGVAEDIANAEHTCALDLADTGPKLFEEVAEAMGMKRQAVQQIERTALRKLRDAGLDIEELRT